MEIKAKVEDLGPIREKLLKMGAKKIADRHQLDVYLSPPHKTFFKTPHYLRVRQDLLNKTSSFDYHYCHRDKRQEKGSGVTTAAHEREVEVKDGAKLLTILKENLDFTENTRIEKKREVFNLDIFEIVLDQVKNLGNFIEIEMDAELADREKCEAKIIEFMAELGVPRDQFCENQGYVELMTNTSSQDWTE